jgi:hypothetical protein
VSSAAALVPFGSLAFARFASTRPNAATAIPVTVATRAASARPLLRASARLVVLMVVLLSGDAQQRSFRAQGHAPSRTCRLNGSTSCVSCALRLRIQLRSAA